VTAAPGLEAAPAGAHHRSCGVAAGGVGERGAAVVILPEIVPARWWQNLLHNQTTLLLKAVLLFRQEPNGAPRVVINVPYYLHS